MLPNLKVLVVLTVSVSFCSGLQRDCRFNVNCGANEICKDFRCVQGTQTPYFPKCKKTSDCKEKGLHKCQKGHCYAIFDVEGSECWIKSDCGKGSDLSGLECKRPDPNKSGICRYKQAKKCRLDTMGLKSKCPKKMVCGMG